MWHYLALSHTCMVNTLAMTRSVILLGTKTMESFKTDAYITWRLQEDISAPNMGLSK